VEGSKFCLFSVIMPAKCVSSISPRFHYRRLAFCFLPLAAILESPQKGIWRPFLGKTHLVHLASHETLLAFKKKDDFFKSETIKMVLEMKGTYVCGLFFQSWHMSSFWRRQLYFASRT
jgi:hypothetical protein